LYIIIPLVHTKPSTHARHLTRKNIGRRKKQKRANVEVGGMCIRPMVTPGGPIGRKRVERE
jgi:hypothetical protein